MKIANKLNTRIVGIVLGILIPIITIFVQTSAKGYSFEFVKDLFANNKAVTSGLLTICLVVNGILFGILIQFKKQLLAIGFFIPTAILGLGLLIYKLWG